MGRRHIEGIGNNAAIQYKITTDDDEEHLKSLKKTFQRLEIHPFASIPPETCTLRLPPHLSRRVMACRAA